MANNDTPSLRGNDMHSCEDNYSYREEFDPTLKFLYRPHSITILVSVIAYFLYVALYQQSSTTSSANICSGMVAAAIVFVFIGVLQLRSSVFIRPHPAFWRAVHAVSILYLMALVFLLFQDVDSARKLMSFFDPALGVPLPEKSYAANCALTMSNLYDQVDFFVIAHALGWYAKALIFRDQWLCWIVSVLFEVMEYSLQHQLPNFAECWWDHWILDVFTCNWLGIWLGMKTCEYYSLKTYSWRSIKDISNVVGKVKRTMAQFTPHSWTRFDWAATKSFKGYIAVLTIIFLTLECELNAFYLKYLLWIPPSHFLNVARVVLIGFSACPAVRETYQYCSDPMCKRLGPQTWVLIVSIVTETLICAKFGKGAFPNPAPENVVLFWKCFIAALVAFPVWQFGLYPRLFKRKDGVKNA